MKRRSPARAKRGTKRRTGSLRVRRCTIHLLMIWG
jgi:hypothetical protein